MRMRRAARRVRCVKVLVAQSVVLAGARALERLATLARPGTRHRHGRFSCRAHKNATPSPRPRPRRSLAGSDTLAKRTHARTHSRGAHPADLGSHCPPGPLGQHSSKNLYKSGNAYVHWARIHPEMRKPNGLAHVKRNSRARARTRAGAARGSSHCSCRGSTQSPHTFVENAPERKSPERTQRRTQARTHTHTHTHTRTLTHTHTHTYTHTHTHTHTGRRPRTS